MPPPVPEPDLPPTRPRTPVEESSASPSGIAALISRALELRSHSHYALHPVEAVIQYHRDPAENPGAESHGGLDFEQAEANYRAGAQGLRLSEIPQLPQQLRELSRLVAVDRAGRKTLRQWVEEKSFIVDEAEFFQRWQTQGARGGAEHQVYHDEDSGRWFKRLYHGVNQSTLGDYLVRMRLHAVLFPETAYRLEGFTLNPKSKALAPVVSQPHVEVDTSRPVVSKEETDALLAAMGFGPVELLHNGTADGGYYAYLHPVTGVLAHDLHAQTVDAMPATLDGLLRRGFKFVTVSQLLAMKTDVATAQASATPATY